MALVHNRPEFVELMLETGVDLKAFLSKRRLYYLYNAKIVRDAEKKCPLLQLFNKEEFFLKQDQEGLRKKLITFKGLKKFLKKYFFEDFKPVFLPRDAYKTDDVSQDDPENQLLKDLKNLMVKKSTRNLFFSLKSEIKTLFGYTFGTSFHRKLLNTKTN